MGGSEKPNEIKRCMKTWEKHLGDYEIKEWNENNFDINSHPYVKEAYDQKKWAYVSDYIRAFALFTEGGIYLDTDVIVLDDLLSFLNDEAFVGFENENYPFTAVFGCVPGHEFVKEILKMYDGIGFQYNKKNEYEFTNTRTVSDILIRKFGVKVNNKEQMLDHGIRVYPDEVLCNPSKSSSTIHIFTGTWIDEAKPLKRKIVKFMKLRATTKVRAGFYKKIFR